MNEQIIEMAIEAGFNPVNCTGSNVPLFEKFGELIVAECIRLCDQVDLAGADDCINNIKQHFGVEK